MATTVEELIVEITAKLDQARADTKAFERQLAELEGTDVKVPVTIDDEASDELAKIDAEIRELEGRKAKISVSADASDAARQMEKIDAEIRELEGRKAKISVSADTGDATRQLSKLESDLAGLSKAKPVEVKFKGDTSQITRDIDDVISKVDKLSGTGAAEILLTTNAAQITNEILDLVADIDKLEATDPTIDVKAANLATLEAGLDKIAAKAKEISSTPVNIDTRSSVAGIDDIARSANSSKSVLANMVGNATQDLGALGGIAGSAGVAIGQMGEYMVDASADGDRLGDVLRNFGKVAGPIAAIGVGIQIISTAMEGMRTEDAFNAGLVEDFNAALREGQTIMSEIRDTATETGQVLFETGAFGGGGLLGLGSQSKDLVNILRELGFTAEETLTILGDPRGSAERFRAQAEAMGFTVTDNTVKVRDAADGLDDYADAQEKAEATEKNRLELVKAATVAEADYTAQLEHQAGLLAQHAADVDKATEAQVRNTEATIEAVGRLGETIGEIREVLSEPFTIGDIAGAVAEINTEMFALRNISSDYQAAVDGISQSLKDNTATWDLNTEAGRANEAALQELGGAVIPEIAANFERAGGSLEAFTAMQAESAATLKQSLIDNGVAAEQAEEIVNRLIPLDGTSIETQFELTGAELAAEKVAQLIPLLASLELSPDILKQVAVAIAAGKGPEDILAIIQTALTGEPIVLPSEVAVPAPPEIPEIPAVVVPTGFGVPGTFSPPPIAEIVVPTGFGVPGTFSPPAIPEVVVPTGFGVPGTFSPPAVPPVEVPTTLTVPDLGPFTGGAAFSVPPVTVDVEGNTIPVAGAISDVVDASYSTTITAEPETGRAETAITTTARPRNMTITAGTDHARAEGALVTTARDRRMTIHADADTASANGELATAARDRRMTITASANTGGAESALDSLTRARTVTITPRVVPTSVLVRVDGGG